MHLAATLLVVLVALEHLGFLVLEMFLWTGPVGLRVFRNTAERARDSATLAANQGLYNGFLAAGLAFGLVYPQPDAAKAITTFFLACVVVAGIYGGYSVSRRILMVQALPAALALACIVLA
jgi:putative membrane protein